MRACEFMTAEDGIAFLKLMMDKTWLLIKTEAEKKAEREEYIQKTKKAKSKSKKPQKKAKPKKRTVRPPKRKPPLPSNTKKRTKKKKPPKKRKNATRDDLKAKKPIPTKKPNSIRAVDTERSERQLQNDKPLYIDN